MEVWTTIILPIISGLVACVPLVITLINVVQKNSKSQNWTALMSLTLKLMTEAETLYKEGSEKKDYVINSIKALEKTLNYDVDIDKVDAMINSIVEATKKINIEKK
jgi:hypothetical protein